MALSDIFQEWMDACGWCNMDRWLRPYEKGLTITRKSFIFCWSQLGDLNSGPTDYEIYGLVQGLQPDLTCSAPRIQRSLLES